MMLLQQANNLFVTKVRTGNDLLKIRYNWSEILLVFSVFSKAIGSSRINGIDFDFIAYPFFILYFILYAKRVMRENVRLAAFYLFIIFASLFSIFMLNLGFNGFLKQIFSVIIIYSVSYTIMAMGDVVFLFRLYVKVAYWTAIFGIIQVIVSFGGVSLMIGEVGRLNSVAYEPSHYAAILIPGLLFAFFHIKEYKREFLVMIIALMLTFNLTGYLVFLLVIAIAYLNPVYIFISIPILYLIIFYGLANFNENFSIRINETLAVFGGHTEILGTNANANGTTTSFYSNLMVALNNIKRNFLLGVGLGGHDESYFQYYQDSLFRFNYYYGLNSQSGHSLTIRILSEFGIVGIIVYITSIVKRLIFNDNGYYKSISLSCLSHFLCKSLKLGGYIDYGTPFFFAMLLMNFTQFTKSRTIANYHD